MEKEGTDKWNNDNWEAQKKVVKGERPRSAIGRLGHHAMRATGFDSFVIGDDEALPFGVEVEAEGPEARPTAVAATELATEAKDTAARLSSALAWLWIVFGGCS